MLALNINAAAPAAIVVAIDIPLNGTIGERYEGIQFFFLCLLMLVEILLCLIECKNFVA